MEKEFKSAELKIAAYNDLTAEEGRALYAGFVKKGIEVDSLRARVAELSDCLNTIVAEYNSPPYTELDWITWKQRAEKAREVSTGMKIARQYAYGLNPGEQLFLSNMIDMALDAQTEECAKVAERLFQNAPNNPPHWEQNAISHGCVASAKAIRALKSTQPKES